MLPSWICFCLWHILYDTRFGMNMNKMALYGMDDNVLFISSVQFVTQVCVSVSASCDIFVSVPIPGQKLYDIRFGQKMNKISLFGTDQNVLVISFIRSICNTSFHFHFCSCFHFCLWHKLYDFRFGQNMNKLTLYRMDQNASFMSSVPSITPVSVSISCTTNGVIPFHISYGPIHLQWSNTPPRHPWAHPPMV